LRSAPEGIGAEKVDLEEGPMKRWLASIVLTVVGLALLPAGAAATHTEFPQPQPQQDSVWGEAKVTLRLPALGTFRAQVHINAQKNPDGTVNGTTFVHTFLFFQEIKVYGRLLCLQVNGNKATAVGIVTKSNFFGAVPGQTRTLGNHTDNGEPGSLEANATPPDLFSGSTVNAPITCPPVANDGVFPVEQGNFVVHDSPTTP
jgi:hypothetical protein